ncbi:MAG: hypothetical protein JWN34_6095 [Bryobacterales bacterium]|jgi:hypothetical protein|nr:hypothetical protein [Bryobacterales bacterium]
MDRVEELEIAIERLPPAEFNRIAEWVRGRQAALWDAQLDSDSASGRLDFLFEEAEQELLGDRVRVWPSNK